MAKKIVIIGGGIAGMEAAATLSERGHSITIVERQATMGGNVANWHKLFPTLRDSSEVIDYVTKRIDNPRIETIKETTVTNITKSKDAFSVETSKSSLEADAILLATGYNLFNARRKEEFGYGIYDNVISSADLEKRFKTATALTTAKGTEPKRIAIIHCVGSRDEKTGNHYCSKVCCVTGVKQAIELRQRLPHTEIICFYIDLRMFAAGFEELYREAQEKWGIQFVRGRLSEAAENMDGSLQIKAEDTLSGRPLKMRIDLMVLLAGMEPSSGTVALGKQIGLEQRMGHFLKPKDEHIFQNLSCMEGIYLAGTCTGPMTINETIADARSAAVKIDEYLNNLSN
jgi:heterodisulfide reductase subunit A